MAALVTLINPASEAIATPREYLEYVIKTGDTLWGIAQKNGSTVQKLKEINELREDLIFPGQVILIPKASYYSSLSLTNATLEKPDRSLADEKATVTYVVKPGDTIWELAQRYRLTTRELRTANNLNSELLLVGQRLVIPVNPDLQREANLYWLARVISAEARGESLLGQTAVGAVVLNRTRSKLFPDSTHEVIFQKVNGVYQFSVVPNGLIYQEPTESAYQAAQLALSGWDPTGGSLYFYNPQLVSSRNWIRTRPVIRVIGDHAFAT